MCCYFYCNYDCWWIVDNKKNAFKFIKTCGFSHFVDTLTVPKGTVFFWWRLLDSRSASFACYASLRDFLSLPAPPRRTAASWTTVWILSQLHQKSSTLTGAVFWWRLLDSRSASFACCASLRDFLSLAAPPRRTAASWTTVRIRRNSAKKQHPNGCCFLVEIAGFEPVTSCVWSRRSNQLS